MSEHKVREINGIAPQANMSFDPNDMVHCRLCMYSAVTPTGIGVCKRFPPTTAPQPVFDKLSGKTTIRWLSVFPQVDTLEWCGEWKPSAMLRQLLAKRQEAEVAAMANASNESTEGSAK